MKSFKEYHKNKEEIDERMRLGSVFYTFPNNDALDAAIRAIKPLGLKFDVQKSKLLLFLKGISDVVIKRITKAIKKAKVKFSKEEGDA